MRGMSWTSLYILFLGAHFAAAQDDIHSCLEAKWTHLPVTAFQLSPGWSNEDCLYSWTVKGQRQLEFSSSLFCLFDKWKSRNATVDVHDSDSLTVRFFMDGQNQSTNVSGYISKDCSFIDMADGSMFVRSSTNHIRMPNHEWIRAVGAWLVRAAQVPFVNGSRVLTPGFPVSYNAFFMRDGFYGMSMLWDLANSTHQKDFVSVSEWVFNHSRADGIMPATCSPQGACQYGPWAGCADAVGAPDWQGCQILDTAGFTVKLAHHIWSHLPAGEQHMFYKRWAAALEKTMNATTKDPDSGLVYSNNSRPMVGYGFTDSVFKSGGVLYSSVLLWNASGLLREMALAEGDPELAARMTSVARRIKTAADAQLWNSGAGMFRAATELESDRLDVWGSAMAGAIGFASEEQASAIYKYFKQNEANIFWEGQVREIPWPQEWASVRFLNGFGMLQTPKDPLATAYASVELYQNGGYWATPHHHVLPFLAMHNQEMACRLLNDTIDSFRTHGIWEWVGPFFPGLSNGAPGYIASAAATYFASNHLRCWEADSEVEPERQPVANDDPVTDLLRELRLDIYGYGAALEREGFERMDALRLASDADLAACGMRIGHRRLLLDRLSRDSQSSKTIV